MNSSKPFDAVIPHLLIEWIDVNMPEIGGFAGVRIRICKRLPFQWVPGFMPTIRGITLWNTIYLKPQCHPLSVDDPDKMSLLFHELVHVGQFRKNWVLFPIGYLFDLVRLGYWNVPAEIEARSQEKRLLSLYREEVLTKP